MEDFKSSMKYCSTGEPTLLVLAIPEVVISEDSFSECFAVPVASRNGGLLVALPDLSVGPQAFARMRIRIVTR